MYTFLPYVKKKHALEIPITPIFEYVRNKDRTI